MATHFLGVDFRRLCFAALGFARDFALFAARFWLPLARRRGSAGLVMVVLRAVVFFAVDLDAFFAVVRAPFFAAGCRVLLRGGGAERADSAARRPADRLETAADSVVSPTPVTVILVAPVDGGSAGTTETEIFTPPGAPMTLKGVRLTVLPAPATN
jgi:hypothetical protein